MNKVGRPRRKADMDKLNLFVSKKAKRVAQKIANDRDTSVGRLVEELVLKEAK